MFHKLLVVFILIIVVQAINNGVARTPPMGLNFFYQFYRSVNEDLVNSVVDGMVSTGLQKLGYQYINLDDFWSQKSGRDAYGRLVPDPVMFPRGLKVVADRAHANNLKFGIYSDLGNKTCGQYPGSYLHYDTDAQTFAEWGVDFLKLDFCFVEEKVKNAPWVYYGQMSKALNNTGRPIVFSICNWGVKQPWTWAPDIANMWRTTDDSAIFWPRIMKVLDAQRSLAKYSGPGAWNDPDMLLGM
jgi:alpha-galactosidase